MSFSTLKSSLSEKLLQKLPTYRLRQAVSSWDLLPLSLTSFLVCGRVFVEKEDEKKLQNFS